MYVSIQQICLHTHVLAVLLTIVKILNQLRYLSTEEFLSVFSYYFYVFTFEVFCLIVVILSLHSTGSSEINYKGLALSALQSIRKGTTCAKEIPEEKMV
jgi:hypothetical protein